MKTAEPPWDTHHIEHYTFWSLLPFLQCLMMSPMPCLEECYVGKAKDDRSHCLLLKSLMRMQCSTIVIMTFLAS